MQLERMVRVYFLLQWYVSDPGMEESLYDIELERRLAGIELGEEEIIDETAILDFHHLLEQHQLTVKLLDEVNGNLCENKLLLKPDTIVDALIPEHAFPKRSQVKNRACETC